MVEAHAPPSHAGTALTDAGAQVLPKHPNLQMQHTSWSAATIDTAAARRRAPEGLGGDTGGGSCSSMSGSQAHDARARFVIERQRRLVTQSSELVHFYRALIRLTLSQRLTMQSAHRSNCLACSDAHISAGHPPSHTRRCRRLVTAPAFQFLLLGTALWCWNYYAMVPIFRALVSVGYSSSFDWHVELYFQCLSD